MLCRMDSSTATTDVIIVDGSRVLCHLDSLTDILDLMSDRYIRC